MKELTSMNKPVIQPKQTRKKFDNTFRQHAVELWLNRLAQVFRRFLETFHRFADLSSDLGQLLRTEQQKRDDQDDEYFAST